MSEQHYCKTKQGARHVCSMCKEERDQLRAENSAMMAVVDAAITALRKIDEPMKYHHWEEDAYTRAACFQFVACEALKQIKAIDEAENPSKP